MKRRMNILILWLKARLPYKYEVGMNVPYYDKGIRKITARKRDRFFKSYSFGGNIWFSESLIEYYLKCNGNENYPSPYWN